MTSNMTSIMVRGLAWALLLWAGLSCAQSSLEPGQRYPAGSTVRAADLGIVLTLPKDWLGAYRQEQGQSVLLLGSNTVEGVGMAIFLRGYSAERVSALLAEAQDLGDNVVLVPDGAVRTEAGRASARYLNALYVGRALALLGPRQNHVLFFYAGPKKNESQYAGLLQGLATSTQFTDAGTAEPPRQTDGWAAKWEQFLSGMMLKYFSSYNSGGGGGGMSSERALHLCGDHSFAYFGASSLSIYVPGATAGGGDTTRAGGRWRIVSAEQNSAVLLLSSDGGGEQRLNVSYDGEKTFIGSERWFRVQSDGCR